jgi:hypothetical protein
MRDLTAVVIGALAGSLFSFAVAFLYTAAIRRIGPKVFQTWRFDLLVPVHIVFAFSQLAPLLVPAAWLQRNGVPIPPTDHTLFAITLVSGILGLIPPFWYFYRRWSQLQAAGYF